jgi:hypothetical protein
MALTEVSARNSSLSSQPHLLLPRLYRRVVSLSAANKHLALGSVFSHW